MEIIDKSKNIDIIKKVIQKENVFLDSLKSCEFEHLYEAKILNDIWDEWIINKKLLSHWENVVIYWEYFGLTPMLIKYIEENCELLMQEQVPTDIDKSLIKDIIKSEMDSIKFDNLISKIPYNNLELPFNEINKEHMQIMIEHNVFVISDESISELKAIYPELVYKFIIKNKIEVLNDLDNYLLDVNDIENLISSRELTDIDKLNFIQIIDPNSITRFVALFLRNLNLVISKELFDNAWKLLQNDEENKDDMHYQLFLNQISILTKDEISEKLNALGGDYKCFSDRSKRHEEKLYNTPYNNKLVEHLKNIDYITSFRYEEKTKDNIITHKKIVEPYIVCW